MNREEQSLEAIRLLRICHKTGMYYPDQKRHFLQEKLQRLCRQAGFTNLEELNLGLQKRTVLLRSPSPANPGRTTL